MLIARIASAFASHPSSHQPTTAWPQNTRLDQQKPVVMVRNVKKCDGSAADALLLLPF